MASGSFTGTTGNKYIKARVEWLSTPDTLKNQSIVTATLYYAKSSSSTSATYGTVECKLTIDGSAKSFSKRITLEPNDAWVLIGSHSVTVPHTSDGSKSVTISATGGIPGLTFSSTNCSATVILDKIPRATTPTFGVATQTIGSNVKIILNAADSAFYHTVSYSWGSRTGTIGTNLKNSVEWAIPMNFCEGVPNGTQGTLFITVETFMSNGVSLGKVTKSTPCDVPASIVPTISSITLTDTGSNIPAGWGVFVRGKSKLHVNVSASGRYYSRIVGYSINALGVTITSNDADVGIIANSGSVNVEVTVTDSRGRTATKSTSVNVEDHFDPVIESFSVERANNLGTPIDNGTYARIPLKISAASISGNNVVTAKIYHMRSDATSWTLARTINVAYTFDDIVMIANMLPSRSYAIKVEVSDKFTTTTTEGTLNAEGAVMGWLPGGIGISFGKAAEEEYTADFDWKIHGRKGGQFDGPIDATAFSIGGRSVLQLVDILSVQRGENMQLGKSSEYVQFVFTKDVYKVNQVLTVSGGGVLIPTGIRYVKVSAQVCLGASTAGVRYVQVAVNHFNNAMARSQRNHASTSVPETHVISGAIIPVVEGDLVILGVYGNANDMVYGAHNQTYLTVEAFA